MRYEERSACVARLKGGAQLFQILHSGSSKRVWRDFGAQAVARLEAQREVEEVKTRAAAQLLAPRFRIG
eukprot:10953337-Lingulodinium_polyedra.AAC.1